MYGKGGTFGSLLSFWAGTDCESVTQAAADFTDVFYTLPPGFLDALTQFVINALSLQERYSLATASNFIACFCYLLSFFPSFFPSLNPEQVHLMYDELRGK